MFIKCVYVSSNVKPNIGFLVLCVDYWAYFIVWIIYEFESVLQHGLTFVLSHQSCHELHSAVEGWSHLQWGPAVYQPGYIFQGGSLETLPVIKMSSETASYDLSLTYILFSSFLWSELHCGPDAGRAEAFGDTRTDVQPKVWSGSRAALCSARQTGMNQHSRRQRATMAKLSMLKFFDVWLIFMSLTFQRFTLGVRLYYKVMEAMLKSVLVWFHFIYFLFSN